MKDVREANINVSGNWHIPVFRELSKRAILILEVREAVNEIKLGKAPWLDRFLVKCLNKGGTAVIELPVRLLNAIFDMGVVPMGCLFGKKFPCYKDKYLGYTSAQFSKCRTFTKPLSSKHNQTLTKLRAIERGEQLHAN